MHHRFPRLVWTVIACLGAGLVVHGQWLHQPMAGAPRTPDGKINMTGPVPMLNGKPDLSGIWQVQGDPRAPGGLFGLGESLNSRYFRDVLSDFKPDERPLTPAGAELLRQHSQPGVFNPTRELSPRWRSPRRSAAGAVQDHSLDRRHRDALRGRDDVPSDLHGRAQAARRSVTDVAGIFGRPMGRRHAGDRDGRLQRSWLAGCARHRSQRGHARRGTFPPPRLRPPRSHDHHHRSQDVHEADHLQRRRRTPAGHRSPGALLRRKRKGRRTYAGPGAQLGPDQGRPPRAFIEMQSCLPARSSLRAVAR